MSLDFKYICMTDDLCSYIRQTRTATPQDSALARLRAETRRFGRLAVMQLPEEQGAFLHMLVSMAQPKRALEVGTFTGYSSICIASGLAPGGRLTTCDTNEVYAHVARKYWRELALERVISYHNGDALSYISALPNRRLFDFVFVDADRHHASEYFDECVARIKVGGVLIFDNMLAKGDIITPKTRSVRERARVNQLAASDPRVESIIAPIGDGMLICRIMS